jgi:hypothetical protein
MIANVILDARRDRRNNRMRNDGLTRYRKQAQHSEEQERRGDVGDVLLVGEAVNTSSSSSSSSIGCTLTVVYETGDLIIVSVLLSALLLVLLVSLFLLTEVVERVMAEDVSVRVAVLVLLL